jgi:hypothetical protein
MTVKASKKAIEALNIQQRKEFKVNSNFLSVLMQAECLNEVSEMPTKKVYEAKYLEYRT